MHALRSFPLVESPSAADRLVVAADFLRAFPKHQPVTIVSATRGAADDFARRLALERGATIGLARYSLTQVASRTAATRLAGRGIAPATPLGIEAVAARVVFDTVGDGRLSYLGRVAGTPGFPRAVARTLRELRLAGVPAVAVAGAGDAGHDLALLLERADAELLEAASADRARLFEVACASVEDDESLRVPLLFLDVAVTSPAEERFVAALAGHATDVCVTVPAHDARSRIAFERAGGVLTVAGQERRAAQTDLECLRTWLFSEETPPARGQDHTLEFFSAPGEGREAVEVARRILEEARRGVRFDQMAIVLRTPQHYHGLLEHALERAGVPAWFERGARRPHPTGRAFLALLACAVERLSAARFAEYLSLGEIPDGPGAAAWVGPADEMFDPALRAPETEAESPEPLVADEGQAAVAGTLRTPRRWERLIVEAAVIGGDPSRWERRLDGLRAELTRRLAEARRGRAEQSQREAGIERDLLRLEHLRGFVLPLVREMAAWPASATWGDWITRLEQFAPRVLRLPSYVLRVLADLRPMANVGPVPLAEVQAVLADRLRLVEVEPSARRYGAVFVASPEQMRGRAFTVVFLPGLAERVFPPKLRPDPLLSDTARTQVGFGLLTRVERSAAERLLLHLVAGAASDRLYVSYPRIDVGEGRVRVPSFYALDVMRGATGRIPDHETLAEAAAGAGDASLAWPAPRDPARAIDDQEHDLAVLRQLLDARDAGTVRGHAQYMLRLNAALRRSVTERWARAEPKWSHFDGLIRVTDQTKGLHAHRLVNRSYSLSALQRFAVCPYQFLLGAVYRLEAAEQPLPLQRLDPLTRGSLVHRMQAEFFRALEAGGALPVTTAGLDEALVTLAGVIERVADAARDDLAPAIDRVWHDEIAAIARDLRGWVRGLATGGGEWTPRYFEFAFGLTHHADERDPRSVPDPVQVDGRFTLRGSIDLIEEHSDGHALRVTDHKTGKNRTSPGLIVGGGEVLQPVLYSLVVERIAGKPVESGRLSYCTVAGGFSEKVIPLTDATRRAGVEVLEIVDRSIELGVLPAAPRQGACDWCDFRPVCGPNEERRIGRKPGDRLADLISLRSRP